MFVYLSKFKFRLYTENSCNPMIYCLNRYERKFPVNNPFDKDKNNKVWDRQRKYDGPKRRSYNHEEEEEPEWMNGNDFPPSLFLRKFRI